MEFGQNFPISDYYRTNIEDARTVTRAGGWWTAVLLIKDPRSEKSFLNLYRWQKRDSEWRVRKTFSIRSKSELEKIIQAMQEFSDKLP